MNKTVKTKIKNIALACALTLMAGLAALPQRAQGQELFTLTNGSLQWYEGTWGSGDSTEVAYDRLSTPRAWAEVHPVNSDPDSITLITRIGTVYMALDTTTTPPSLKAIDTAAGFDPLCVWTRTGSTGYYYQNWGSYRYYLVGSRDGVKISKVGIREAIDNTSYWYDWDFGAAITYVGYPDGVRTENYHWLLYDTTGGQRLWRMSPHCYNRPEAAIYNGYTYGTDYASLNASHKTYYYADTLDLGGGNRRIVPAGHAAQFMPVDTLYQAKDIYSIDPSQGLVGFAASAPSLAYGEAIDLLPQVSIGSGYQVTVMPQYTAYRVETHRYGIHKTYTERAAIDGYGGTGVPTRCTYYYYSDAPGSAPTRHTVLPPTSLEPLVVLDTLFSLNPGARRFAELDTTGPVARLRCISVPPAGASATVTVTVRYTNGTSQSLALNIGLSNHVATQPMPSPTRGPVVKAVFGGGRMASVGGATRITVHSCDSIQSVYGGNDIAGWVQGADGSTLQIGTTGTDAAHPVRIGHVYGGGCGLYLYRGVNFSPLHGYPYLPDRGSRSLNHLNYYFGLDDTEHPSNSLTGQVYAWSTLPTYGGTLPDDPARNIDTSLLDWSGCTLVADGFAYAPAVDLAHEQGKGGNGTIPYIRKTHITVGSGDPAHDDHILVDSLFGGAENAFVGLAPTDSSVVRVLGGTLFALFGGNNYGGSLAPDATASITVGGTRLTDQPGVANTYFGGYGRQFGIRYLFGGGNLVASAHTEVSILGGMVDTCFLGGNRATVSNPVGTVNCTGTDYIFDNPSITTAHPLPASFASLADHDPASFTSRSGRYNVRCLFGGNNQAAMDNLSTLHLVSGGVSTVFGGGNAGDMRETRTIDAVTGTSGFTSAMFEGWPYEQPSVVGAYIHSGDTSQIMVEHLYGGCRMSNVKGSSLLWLSGGCFGYVNGGNDISGDVGTELDGEGSWVVIDRNALVLQNVYGGSNGLYHCHKNGRYMAGGETLADRNGTPYDPYEDYIDMLVPTQNRSNLYLHGGQVLLAAYGGGVMTDIGFGEESNNYLYLRDSLADPGTLPMRPLKTPGAKQGAVHIMLNGGTIGSPLATGGNAYGGGYLSYIHGLSYFRIKGNTTVRGSVYAGNDCMGSIDHFGAYTLPGIAAADLTASDGTTALNEKNTDTTWKATYSAYLLIEDEPTIGCVYGSGNGAYNYDGLRPEYSSHEPVCQDEAVDNRPFQSSTFIDIHTSGGTIDTVFGGGNGVGVRESVRILLNCTSGSVATVGTIFGGNNRDTMRVCVPDIVLNRGTVKNVFGGGNAGGMSAQLPKWDICGRMLDKVSTYVLVSSEEVTVTDELYGGCRMADVKGMAYIDVRGTSHEGIQYIYGGNDISGNVDSTRIDINDGTVHHIYGGSNGYYDYVQMAHNDYHVFGYGSAHADGDTVALHTSGSPYVDQATVNVFGGSLMGNVFGGGRLGDCRITHVNINDRICDRVQEAKIYGTVFGGGEGVHTDLNQPRRGNVLGNDNGSGASHVHLQHASLIEGGKAYGGGKGGDVENTFITVDTSWKLPFDELYGGCWGSDVYGTAHLELNGSDVGDYNVRNLFGGNDFTGNVYKTDITITSGIFLNVYGGGNGANYVASDYSEGVYADVTDGLGNITELKHLDAPNNEYGLLTLNGGTVTGNLYGGGKLGTTFTYKKDPVSREYLLDATTGRKQADTNSLHSSATDYAYAIINMHGGEVLGNIYAGAAGAAHGNWLFYGLKNVNMDGGVVDESIYGGSENVSDGYSNECIDKEHTTARPSSIVNIAGGTVRNNVYGGGYLGNVYGSAYVNVGIDAIDSCVAYSRQINGTDSAYALFRPGAANGLVGALVPRAVLLESSIYGGADWGDNTGSADFSVQGFYGGESRIIVNGRRYNTYMDDEHESLPLMTIANSLIGSGTSADGGDVYNSIEVRNYGAIDPVRCIPTRSLRAIQRTNSLSLRNTAINYTGSTDAITALATNQYTIHRIDTLNCFGYNIIDINAMITNIGEAHFYEPSRRVHTTNHSFPLCYTADQDDSEHCPACAADASLCTKLRYLHREEEYEGTGTPPTEALTAIMMNSGINIEFINKNNEYSPIYGYAYLLAQNNTNAVVTARAKYGQGLIDDGESVTNGDDGGFMSVCSDSLMAIKAVSGSSNEVIEWCNCIIDADGEPTENSDYCLDDLAQWNTEYPYHNYGTVYRVWTIGHGIRRRFAVIQAHSNPDTLDVNKKITVTDEGVQYHLSLAKAVLTLPPTTPGHYYKVNSAAGVSISDENEELKLVEKSWHPESWNTVSDTWGTTDEPHGAWATLTVDEAKGAQFIYNNPGNYFGLLMMSGKNFATYTQDDADNGLIPAGRHVGDPLAPITYHDSTTWTGSSTISGNDHINIFNNFSTAQVGASVNASPEIDLYLTYDNNFSHTLLGTVTLTLDECVARWDAEASKWVDSNINAPIEVTITISTILQEFNDMEYEMLAMYNDGRTNIFSRKAVLPATLQHRELYLKAIEWAPTSLTSGVGDDEGNGEWITTVLDPAPDWFYLTGDSASIITDNDANRFRLTIQPMDNISNVLVTSVGWHSMSIRTPLDLYSAALHETSTKSIVSKGNYYLHDTLQLDGPHGIKIGELDGRGEAALNLNLNFDGNKTYKKPEGQGQGKGYIGKAILTLVSYTGGDYESPNEFHLTVNIKTRERGDTIYVASADSIGPRGGKMLHGTTNLSIDDVGKRPSLYLKRFKDAFDPIVYQEGDVIAVLDTVKITGGEQIFVHGYDYNPIPIIRYHGHHADFPGEACVYRGTMFDVSGSNAAFTARNINFNGSMMGKVVPGLGDVVSGGSWANHPRAYNRIDPSDVKYADTNAAYGPIIAVHDNANVTLQNGVTATGNYNRYAGADSTLFGTISVTGNGSLNLMNSVTIRHNLDTLRGDTRIHPLTGAVHVDGGTVQLMASNKGTAMTIQDNYLYNGGPYWKENTVEIDGVQRLSNIRFDDSEAKTGNYTKGNLFLTRTASPHGDADMNDAQSDLVRFPDLMPLQPGTSIGISKWFPDEAEAKRDTIQIAYQESALYLTEAIYNNNFTSDGDFFVFYNYGVNAKRIYLQRCATFNYQTIAADPFFAGSELYPDAVLSYRTLHGATCPTSGDTLIYRVQGGFLPYTYQWTGSTEQSRTTRYTNNDVQKDLALGHYESFREAIADTLITSHVAMPHHEFEQSLVYTVTATDASGNCKLTKDIDVTLIKDVSGSDIEAFTPTGTVANWTSGGEPATGDRRYKAVRVIPQVWADRSLGIIEASITGDTKDSIYTEDEFGVHVLSSMAFCEGDVINLVTAPRRDSTGNPTGKFIMWDCAPYYDEAVTYVVPATSSTVTAYYGPLDYWIHSVNDVDKAGAVYDTNYYYTGRPHIEGYTSTSDSASHYNAGYVTTYNGDVHIYDENGLAWFISVVNGLNGTQARPFRYNKVFLHQKSDSTAYDMKAHLWTPVGTQQHRFRGRLIGIGSGGERVVVKNILVNEPYLDHAGFFAFLDSARISGIELQSTLVRGAQYVGALAATSTDSYIDNCSVLDSTDNLNDPTTTILTTHYVSGGLVGRSEGDTITRAVAKAKYMGDAVYSGGIVGYGLSSAIANSASRNLNYMSGLYLGGLAGYLDGTAPYPAALHAKSSTRPSLVANNYVHLDATGGTQRVGGLVGYARNTVIENNYVFGHYEGTATEGGVGAVLDEGSQGSHNYYEQGSVQRTAGQQRGNAVLTANTSFLGKGNQVELADSSYGVSNLTRALNLWVRSHGDTWRTWRSDLDGTNHGYPLFGQPDLIPVSATLTLDGCDSIVYDGFVYTADTTLESHVVDSLMMVDSTATLHLVVHRSSHEHYADSSLVGLDYHGYGFSLTAAESELLRSSVELYGSATLILSDTLTSSTGCDSIVSLALTLHASGAAASPQAGSHVSVYPNPTTAHVTIEATGLSRVELYDNEGRRLRLYSAPDTSDRLCIDIGAYASGFYYLRVHSHDGVTIQKLVKQ